MTAVNVNNITGGPASLTLGGTRLSHTHGGVTVKVGPKNRMRTVDQYGTTSVAIIHTGDDVKVTAPLAEWTAQVLAEIYNPGLDMTADAGDKFIGIGRSAGFIYTTAALVVLPLLTADAGKKCEFYKAAPVGEFEIKHSAEDDRIFNVEFACIADPNGTEGDTDGQMIGKIYLSVAA